MTTSDQRDALAGIKARLDARMYVVHHGDEREWRTAVTASQANVPRLTEALEAALSEHTPRELDWWIGPERFCHQCMGRGVPLRLAEWPCPTVRAVGDALNEEEQE